MKCSSRTTPPSPKYPGSTCTRSTFTAPYQALVRPHHCLENNHMEPPSPVPRPKSKKLPNPRQRPPPTATTTLPPMLTTSSTNLQRHTRSLRQHFLHTLTRTRRALHITRRANILTKLFALFRCDEGFTFPRQLFDGFGVEANIGFEADEKDGCAGAIAVDFGYPLWEKRDV